MLRLKIIPVIFIAFINFGAFAQKVKYKDVYPLFQAKNYDAAYPLLKVILKGDTSIPSANLHIGTIFYTKAKAFDVLKENEAAAQYCDSAIFYLKRAQRLVNEKEIRKNDEYYTTYQYNKKDTTKPITLKDTILKRVAADIEFKMKDAAFHKNSIRHIFSLFNKSVGNYAKAGQLYRNINSRYLTVKELYMLSDAGLYDELNQSIAFLDSSVFYLDAYKKAIAAYPIKGYHQQYELENIETYRLDGFKKTDFLGAKLLLWDYAKWAKSVLHILDTDIKTIREKLLYYDDLYNATFDRITARTIVMDSALAIVGDKKLHILVNKYDYNSMALKLLDYKQKKLDFLASTLSRYNIDTTNSYNFEAKTVHFNELNKKISVCDSFLQTLQNVNLTKESPKYAAYITKKFVDVKGIKSYINTEKDFVGNRAKEYKEIYNNLMYDYLQKYTDTTLYLTYNSNKIPLFEGFDYSKTNVKTTCIKEDKKGNIYIGGYMTQGNGASSAFLCKSGIDRQVIWFKNISTKIPGALSEFTSIIQPIDENCIILVNTKTAAGIKNTAYKFDKNGLETMTRKFETGAVARQLVYDEINDNFILALKGESPLDFTEKEELLTISCFDNTGTAKWTNKFNLMGNVADLNKVFEGYLLSCNYTTLSTGSTVMSSKAGTSMKQTNIFLLKITINGQVSKFETISSETPLYTVGTVKVSNSNINIISFNESLLPNWIYVRPGKEKRTFKTINSGLEFVH